MFKSRIREAYQGIREFNRSERGSSSSDLVMLFVMGTTAGIAYHNIIGGHGDWFNYLAAASSTPFALHYALKGLKLI